MTAPYWRFGKMSQSVPNEDPVQGEFFTSATDLPERFVRETIQNSLDAATDLTRKPVHIRFAFNRGDKELPPEKAKPYLRNLKTHLDASFEALDFGTSESEEAEHEALEKAAKLLSGQMSSLVVEDFATTGLTGSIYKNSPLEKNNNFWGFFRSVGISPKSEDAAGSWGLGKWVFSDASRINAVIGVTQRAGEPHPLLMGQTVLKTHTLLEGDKDIKYPAYGSFSAHSDKDDSDWLPLPVGETETASTPEDLAFIQQAMNDFNLLRKDETGLSVIIPFPKDELTADSIAQAVVVQYFLPILKRQLVVTIADSDGDVNGDVRRIDTYTIDDEIARLGSSDHEERSADSLMKLIGLARWALNHGNNDPIRMDVPQSDSELFSETELEDLRARFDRGEPLAFQLKTKVARQSSKSDRMDAGFNLFIERDETLTEGHDYYVRGHLHIPHMDYLKKFKARSLVLVDGKSELGHLLRDSEGPAHTEWNENAERLKKKWSAGRRRVREVRNAPGRILTALTKISTSNFENILADIFPSEIAGDDGGGTKNGTNGGRVTGPTPPPPPPPALQVSRIANGFQVSEHRNAEEVEDLIGAKWHLAFAYDLERGSKNKALKRFEDSVKYGYPDFSLYADIDVLEQDNCEVKILAENKLEIEILDVPFRLEVRGFDNRDVITEIFELPDHSDELDDLTESAMQGGAS